jgi:hypothetical protein
MNVGWPEGLLLAWFAIILTVAATNDGQPLPPPHDRYRFGVTALRIGLFFGLLWWGGFFS